MSSIDQQYVEDQSAAHSARCAAGEDRHARREPVQDRRDDPTNAHRGIYNSLDLGLAEHILGGNKNYLRFLGRNSYYKTIKGDWVLASNTQFGWIPPVQPRQRPRPVAYVPLPEHFFGGGSTSHRGFPTTRPAPAISITGFPLGGNALFFHLTELRFRSSATTSTASSSTTWANLSAPGADLFPRPPEGIQDFDYMVHAAGFGVRYRTPVGPVRVDLAYSINPPTLTA